jgi:hypothetical protein
MVAGDCGRFESEVEDEESWAVWIFSISAMEFSRARTTSWAPRSRANSTPAALVTVSWVEVWIGKSGESARMRRQMPTSWTMAASTPAAMMVRR